MRVAVCGARSSDGTAGDAGAGAGGSYGELVALSEAGIIDARALCALTLARGESMAECASDPSAMAAVRAERARVEAMIEPGGEITVTQDPINIADLLGRFVFGHLKTGRAVGEAFRRQLDAHLPCSPGTV